MKIQKCRKNHIIFWRCDPDLWPTTLKSKSGQDTITTNVYTKFENNPSRGLWVIALTPLRAAGGGRLRRKIITSPDPSDTGDIINTIVHSWENVVISLITLLHVRCGSVTRYHAHTFRTVVFGDCHFHLAINYADFCMRLSASVVVRMADSISGIFSSNLLGSQLIIQQNNSPWSYEVVYSIDRTPTPPQT